jgi:branched-subunit amino acid transport protein
MPEAGTGAAMTAMAGGASSDEMLAAIVALAVVTGLSRLLPFVLPAGYRAWLRRLAGAATRLRSLGPTFLGAMATTTVVVELREAWLVAPYTLPAALAGVAASLWSAHRWRRGVMPIAVGVITYAGVLAVSQSFA